MGSINQARSLTMIQILFYSYIRKRKLSTVLFNHATIKYSNKLFFAHCKK